MADLLTTRYCLTNPEPEPTPPDLTILHFVPDADCEHFVEFSQDCSSYLPLKRYHDETQLIDYVGPGVIRKDVPVMITYVSALGCYVLGSLPDNNQFAGWHTSAAPIDIGPGSAKRHYKSFGLQIDIDFNGIPRKEAVQEIYNGSFDGDIVIKFATTLSGITTIYRDTVITSDMTLKSGSRVKLVANGDDQWVMVDRTPDDTAVGAVLSVFSRTGHVTAQFSDYAIFYAPLTHVGSRDLVTGHPLATPALDGFMSGADKTTTDKAVTADVVFGADERVLVADGAVRGAKTVPITIDADGNIDLVKTLGYLTNLTTKPPWKEGVSFYDENDKCEVVYNEVAAVTQQGGREIFIRGYNAGPEIADGKPVSVIGTDPDGWPILAITDASNKLNALAYIGVSTHDIPNGTFGYVSITGAIRGLDTSLLIENAPLWVDPANPGEYIQYLPNSPAYEVRVGGVSKSDPLEGIIYSRPRVFDNTQSHFKFFNGSMLESPILLVLSDGVNATCEVDHPDLTSDLSLMFNEEYVTPPGPYIVGLTEGTDEVPVRNWVYFPESTQLLTVSLTGFPTTEQFVPVADIMVQSALTAQQKGFYKVHAWTDHLAGSTGQGHLSHLNEWIRNRPAAWISGCVLTPSAAEGVAVANLDLQYTSGVMYQLHKHTFPVFDSSLVEDPFFVWNDSVTPYKQIPAINAVDINADAVGGTLNNKVYSLVIWGVISELDQDCQVYINLPTGSYTTVSGGIADANNTAAYSLPGEFTGTSFLLTRLVLQNQGGNVKIVTGGTFDLRGLVPAASGGVTGGSGVSNFTELLDTPLSYAGYGGAHVIVDGGETGLAFVLRTYIQANGVQPMTADWDFGGYDLTNVDRLDANSAYFSSDSAVPPGFTPQAASMYVHDTLWPLPLFLRQDFAASYAALLDGSGGEFRIGSYQTDGWLSFRTDLDVERMVIAADGTVTIVGNVSAANLSGTNTGDQVIPPQTYLHADLTDVSEDQHHAKSHAHDGADGSGTVAHGDLTGVSSDQHHPQIHDHSTHTNIGTDDHHAKSHAHDGVDGSGTVSYPDLTDKPTIPPDQTYLHDDLTDVSADQHHAKSHAHDGVDGSGEVSHTTLSGVSADQHHAKAHAHTDTDGSGSIINATWVTSSGRVVASKESGLEGENFFMGSPTSADFPRLNFDRSEAGGNAEDYIGYARATNTFLFVINDFGVGYANADGWDFSGDLGAGKVKTVDLWATGNVSVGKETASYPLDVLGDINATQKVRAGNDFFVVKDRFYMGDLSANPAIWFDLADALVYDRSDNEWQFYIGGTSKISLSATLADFKSVPIVTLADVGIGTSTPAIKLEVMTNSSGRAWEPTAITAALFERNLANAIEIVSGNASYGSLDFGDTDAATRGSVRYDHADNAMYFRTDGAERMRITSAGGVLVGKDSGLERLSVFDGEGTPSAGSANYTAMFERHTDGGSTVNSTVAFVGNPAKFTQLFMGDYDDYDNGRIRYDNLTHYMGLFTNKIEQLRIDTDGNVEIYNGTVKAKACISDFTDLQSASVQDHGGVAGTIVYSSWNGTELHKDTTTFTHSTSTNPSRVIVNTTGRYSINAVINVQNTGSARVTLRSLYRISGGTVVYRGSQSIYSRGATLGDQMGLALNVEVQLTAGQYIEVGSIVDQTDATYVVNSVPTECQLIMRRIG